MSRSRFALYLPVLLAALAPAPAFAWGQEGHAVVAAIARSYLTPSARQKVDALLATDTDTLTRPDMLSRASWADAWRATHHETGAWHFVDVELDDPDLKAACFGNPSPDNPPSAGPAKDCVVDKVGEFAQELAAPSTPPAERLLALKYVLHFVGDMHQPLHAADNHDRGGNCVRITLGAPGDQRTGTLHAYWDTGVVEEQGHDAQALADQLRARITPAEKAAWEQGTPADWAMETFRVAKASAYTLGTPAGCSADAAPIALPAAYDAAARPVADLQLERAGVRLALVLNRALGS